MNKHLTRRRLISALVSLPFVGVLFRQRLDVIDVVEGAAPTPVVFSIRDAAIYVELDRVCRPDEFTTIAVEASAVYGDSRDVCKGAE